MAHFIQNLVVMTMVFSGFSGVAEDSADVSCTLQHSSGALSFAASPGVVTGFVRSEGGNYGIGHETGVDLSQWAQDLATKIKFGTLAIVERTKESPSTVSLLTADIENGSIENFQTRALFLQFGMEKQETGNFSCYLAEAED